MSEYERYKEKNKQNLIKYAESFFNAAEYVINEIMQKKNHIRHRLILPVLYMYRHSLELIIKANVMKFIHKYDESIKNSHGLLEFFNRVKYDKNDYTQWLRGFLQEIDSIDEESIIFRYPCDTQNAFIKDNRGFSMLHVQETMSLAFKILKNLYTDETKAYKCSEQLPSEKLFVEDLDYNFNCFLGGNCFTSKFKMFCQGYTETFMLLTEHKSNLRLFYTPINFLFF